jgi:REP element-mobilizing transposase RayT
MTSPRPLLYDTCYHIYNRGVNRANIFIEERNYDYFMKLYARHIAPVAETFAYCLLRNHFHLLVRIKSEEEIFPTTSKALRVSLASQDLSGQGAFGNRVVPSTKPLGPEREGSKYEKYPSKKFSDFFNAYAKAINKAHNRTGSLFQHPFGRVPVTSERQFWNVIAYIHQNPQKHRFVRDFREWKYSSYGVLLSEKPTFLQRETVLDWFGGKDQYLALHTQWLTDAQGEQFAPDDLD